MSPGSTCSQEHLVSGAAPVSSQRLQASAEHYGPVLNHPAEHRGTAQSAIFGGPPLSAICAKPSSARAAVRPNPHRPPTPLAFPRVRSSEAFGRRPLSVSTALTGPASETLTDCGRSPRIVGSDSSTPITDLRGNVDLVIDVPVPGTIRSSENEPRLPRSFLSRTMRIVTCRPRGYLPWTGDSIIARSFFGLCYTRWRAA